MSRIRSVTTKGFKAEDRVYELGNLNFLRGPVGIGKSQLGDAIQFAALGCIPRIGKTEAASGKLMTGTSMETSVSLEDGRTIGQTLRREGRTLKGGAEASWMPIGTGATEAADNIQSLFGASALEAQQNLDIMRLLELSGSKLAEAIEVLLDEGGLSAEERVDMALVLWNSRIDALREEVDGLRQPIPPSVRAALQGHTEAFKAQVSGSLVKAIAWAGAEKRNATNEASDLVKTRAALENRMNELRAPAESAEQLKARKLEAERRKTELTTQIEMAEKAIKEREQAGQAVAKASDSVVTAESDLEVLKAKGIDTAALREEAKAISDPPEIEPLVEQRLQARAEWDERRAEVTRLREEADAIAFDQAPTPPADLPVPDVINAKDAWLDMHAAKRALGQAQGSPWSRAKANLTDLSTYGFENEAGGLSLARPFIDLVALADENAEDLESLQAKVAETTEVYTQRKAAADHRDAQIAEVKGKNTAQSQEHAAAVERWQEVENERVAKRNSLRAKAKEIETSLKSEVDAEQAKVDETNAAAKKAWEARRSERAEICKQNKTEISRLNTEADNHDEAISTAKTELATAISSLESARARVQGITDAVAVDTETSNAEIEELKDTITRTSDALTLCEQASALATEMQTLIHRIDRATASKSVFSAAEWALKRLRDQDMDMRSQALEAQMARFLAAAGRKETPYLLCEKGAAEFGWRTPNGSKVAVEVLSGGQAIFFKAALAFAVILARNPEIKILLLELAEASDGEVAEAILKACEAVCSEVQVIVASCAPVRVPNKNWTIIDLAQIQEVGA